MPARAHSDNNAHRLCRHITMWLFKTQGSKALQHCKVFSIICFVWKNSLAILSQEIENRNNDIPLSLIESHLIKFFTRANVNLGNNFNFHSTVTERPWKQGANISSCCHCCCSVFPGDKTVNRLFTFRVLPIPAASQYQTPILHARNPFHLWKDIALNKARDIQRVLCLPSSWKTKQISCDSQIIPKSRGIIFTLVNENSSMPSCSQLLWLNRWSQLLSFYSDYELHRPAFSQPGSNIF